VGIVDAISATSNWAGPSGERLGFSTGSSPSSIIRTPGVSPDNASDDDEDDNEEGEEVLGTCSRTRTRAHVCLWHLPFFFSISFLLSLFSVCYWSLLCLLFDSLVVTISGVSAGSSSLPCSSPLWPAVASISSSLSVVTIRQPSWVRSSSSSPPSLRLSVDAAMEERSTLAVRRKI